MKNCNIVFLPGMFAGGWIWKKVRNEFVEQGYTVTIMDQCISGVLGDNLIDARTKLNNQLSDSPENMPIVLVGNSLGSLIAADFARHFPDKVKGVVLSGCPGLNDVDWGVSLRDLKRGTPKAFETLASRLAFHRETVTPEMLTAIHKNFDAHFISIFKWIKVLNEYDIVECIDEINCPIQLIWGAEDGVTLKDPWIELSKEVGHMSYAEIFESGHSPMVETPTEFSEILLNYLSNISKELEKENKVAIPASL